MQTRSLIKRFAVVIILCLMLVTQSCQKAPAQKAQVTEIFLPTQTAGSSLPAATEVIPTQEPVIQVTTQPSEAVPVETAVTPTEPTGGQEINVSFAGVDFIVPSAVARSVRSTLVPARTDWSDLPYFDYFATHMEFELVGYPITEHIFKARIEIYPVDIIRRYNSVIADRMDEIEEVIATKNLEQKELPFLPMINAVQVIHPKREILNFQNGEGYRFLTVYSQAVNPIANYDLFYAYQGLTSDGKYLVVAYLPVNAPVLPADSNTIEVPPGGVPFIDTRNFDPASVGPYKEKVSQVLESLQPGDFTPSLNLLDNLLGSIRVGNAASLYPACPALLQVNSRAYISLNPPTRNRLRTGPGTSENIAGVIEPGTVVELLSGPVCSDNLVFWNVRVPSLDMVGWTAESNFKEQWLLPCPKEGNCPPDWVK